MKPFAANTKARQQSGISLLQCVVYIGVFAVLLGIGMGAFYFCWDHTRAVIATADEIESALHAGERWRADVRAATGKISVAPTAAGEVLKIPTGNKEIIYRFASGSLVREESPEVGLGVGLLEKVKASAMSSEPHSGVAAWRWELELTPRRKEANFPLRFTFEAAQTNR